MKNRFIVCVTFVLLLGSLILIQTTNAVPKKGKLRVSGDNTWVAYVNGEKLAEGTNWQAPTVSEFTLDKGFAVIAVYVHDAEPGNAGVGGFLADIILDDTPDYIGTGEDGWRCDSGILLANRNDGWEKIDFDDSDWETELQAYEKFGGGAWAGGTAAMQQIFGDPECEANWVWCGPNDGEDDIYFRYTIGTLPVEPQGKITTSWARIKKGTL
jgi:hypothetical protein